MLVALKREVGYVKLRKKIGLICACPIVLFLMVLFITTSAPAEAIDIGSRLELFVDDYLVANMQNAEYKMHPPVEQKPSNSPLPKHAGYMTILKDNDLYRAYYRSNYPGFSGNKKYFAENPDEVTRYAKLSGHTPATIKTGKWFAGHPGECTCYAESKNGYEWIFPNLGIYEFEGTTENNVILANTPPLSSNFSPFIDTNPNADKSKRYKALAGHPGYGDRRGTKGTGLHALVSSDGIHWKDVGEVIPYPNGAFHAFDSQNVAFWSEAEQLYVCYFRSWWHFSDNSAKTLGGGSAKASGQHPDAGKADQLRSISRTTSPDFKNWSAPVEMNPNLPGEHLYTNQTHPYFRAPHIYIALPTRYAKGWLGTENVDGMLGSTDILFMSSRAGSTTYDRTFKEAYIRPGMDVERWKSRANYVALNVQPTGPCEMSIWHQGSGCRYALRTDGFISINAGIKEGHMTTKPISFSGNQLQLNVSTSALGSVRVEILTAAGKPIKGFSLDECDLVVGDKINYTVSWNGSSDVAELAGKPIRLRFVLAEADLYAMRFAP